LEIGLAAILVAMFVRRPYVAPSLLGLGVVLLVGALARPALLDPIARRWLSLAAVLARVTTPIVLALLYFVVATPVAFLRRTIGRSPLRRDPRAGSYWITARAYPMDERRSRMERQF
jgi:hypothetical protein